MDFRRVLFRSGGTWSVTPTRLPYVGSLAPGLYSASGFSGLCVVLAPYFGRILGDAIAGDGRALDRLSRLPVQAFPGGRWLRWTILAAGVTMFAISDRLRGSPRRGCGRPYAPGVACDPHRPSFAPSNDRLPDAQTGGMGTVLSGGYNLWW